MRAANNTLYPRMNTYIAVPPLALPLNDQTTSTTRVKIVSPENDRAGQQSVAKKILKSVAARLRKLLH